MSGPTPGAPAVRLAVFDCDGTLVDSAANIVSAMREGFAAVGVSAPDDHAVRHVVGLSLGEIMPRLVPDGDDALHAALVEGYRTAYHRLRATGALAVEPLYPGIRDLLAALDRGGWALGIATGKGMRGLTAILDHHDIGHHFVTLQTADRHPSKPHPAMLELAMAQAGATTATTAMIGDTAYDMAMAVAAGVRAIGVDWGYHDAATLLDAGAGAVVRDAAALRAALG